MGRFYREYTHVLQPQLLQEKYESLLHAPIRTLQELEQWIMDQSILYEEVMETTLGHRLEFNLDTRNQDKKQRMLDDQSLILPIVEKYTNKLDKRLLEHPLKQQLNQEKYHEYFFRKINENGLFHEGNLERMAEIEGLALEYVQKISSIRILWEEEMKPEFQLQKILESDDRMIRKEGWIAIQKAHLSEKSEIEEIFEKQLKLRHEVAIQAGFHNFRDYSFHKLGRLDYSPEDCMQLAENIRRHVLPVKRMLDERSKSLLGVEPLRPWDVTALLQPIKGQTPRYPFHSSQELIEKGMKVFNHLDPSLSNMIQDMVDGGYFDIDARDGKSAGALCLPMLRSGQSFLLMNVNGHYSNIRTFVHELGHAFHNMQMKDQTPSLYRIPPMETAEFASLTMEYLTLDYWWEFYEDEEEFRRAKKMQLEGFINFLSFGIVIDLFQHWIYENPKHSVEERNEKYIEIAKQFFASSIDYTGIEEYLTNRWRTSRHAFESPFYSIEYVIANIAAVEMYRQFKIDNEGTFNRYKKALSLGSSKSMKEVYEVAGVSLQVSESQLKQLVEFVQSELYGLEKNML